MARLIQKSSFMKASSAKGYMQYIASRKGVEAIKQSGPATTQQKQMISAMLKSHPEIKHLHEYGDYKVNKTAANACSLISVAKDFSIMESPDPGIYMKYIATRPGAEKCGEHGLFSAAKTVDLGSAMTSLEAVNGYVWAMIYSIHRDDAERLGYDSAERWRTLICSHQHEFAEALHIPPNRLRWYAAFHNEGHHPHIHMMVWSADGDGYLSKAGLEKMRSFMTNDIFEADLHELYVQKDLDYRRLRDEAKAQMQAALTRMDAGTYADPVIAEKMALLVSALDNCTGKKQYGYLPKYVKRIVDDIVDALSQNADVAECYDAWCTLQETVEHYYHDQEIIRVPLSQRKEFRAIKNMVIKEAEVIRQQRIDHSDFTSSEKQAAPTSEVSSHRGRNPSPTVSPQDPLVLSSAIRLMHHMSNVFRSNALPPANPKGLRVESKRRKKLQQKRIALGHKPKDHEEEASMEITL